MAYGIYPTPHAEYAYGVLVGVTANAFSSEGQIDLGSGTVHDGNYTAPVVYDAADTRDTFTLSDGTVGTLSYTIPWASVDPNQASQSLTPTTFNLNIAGQNFASGTATYSAVPALRFEYGGLKGVSFALTPAAGFACTSFTGSFDINGDNIITAIQAGTAQQFTAAPKPDSLLVLNFVGAYTGADHRLTPG